MLHFAVWTLLHFTFPKSHFIKVHVNFQSSQVLSLPDTSGNEKDLLPVVTLQYHKLRSCSYNILTHHLFFQVGFCPGYLPTTPNNKVRRALALAQGSYEAGSRAGQGQDGGGVNFSHLQLL